MKPEETVASPVGPQTGGRSREADGANPELLAAVARRDLAAVQAAADDGVDVNFLDTDGMTPLHHAVAHRGLDMVETLLRLGADPMACSGTGNSVCFASLDDDGEVAPCAQRIDNDRHAGIIVALVEAGADVNARDRQGRTLTDLAIATVPYPDQIIEYLRHRDGHPAQRATSPLTEQLRDLSPGDWPEQAARVNEVRYRLERDTDPAITDALHQLLEPEWTEEEVSAETLFELTDLLLYYGAENTVMDGSNPLDRAYELFSNGQRPQYQVVTYRLCKAGFTRSLRSLLEWLPEGEATVQRAHIAEVRDRLKTTGPQPDTLHWLLSAHGWYEHEVGGEILGELTDLLLEHGADNTAVNGRTPLGWARYWLDRGDHSQYRVVVDRLLAAGATYSVRDFLDRIPKGDTEDQREYLVELRERLEMDGPQADALHWLLSPNSKWTADEVSGEILDELTELLLDHGARDVERDDSRPLERALNRVEHDRLDNYLPVVRRLKAAGFKSG